MVGAKEAGTKDPVFLSETGAALSVRSIQSLISGDHHWPVLSNY
jgi:hypothetical protein